MIIQRPNRISYLLFLAICVGVLACTDTTAQPEAHCEFLVERQAHLTVDARSSAAEKHVAQIREAISKPLLAHCHSLPSNDQARLAGCLADAQTAQGGSACLKRSHAEP